MKHRRGRCWRLVTGRFLARYAVGIPVSPDESEGAEVNYPLLDVFLTMFFLFMWILWIFLVIRIAISIFKSDDLSGAGKAGWLILVILLPFIGVIAYVIARGARLADDQIATGGAPQDENLRTYERYMRRG
jgi:hypothetical protein